MDETIAAAERATRERIRQQWTRFLERRGWLAESPQDDLDVLAACLAYLGASDAEYLLVNLEDLWLETAPQNTPGTTTQRVNWRRKAKRSLEEIRRDARIGQILGRINALRAN
jgi:4-alpha-glucanotransferase